MNECVNCPVKEQLAKLEAKYSESRQRLYTRIEQLERAAAVTDERYSRILAEIEEINEKLKDLSAKPAKRMDTAVTAMITAAVGGFIGFIISKLTGGA